MVHQYIAIWNFSAVFLPLPSLHSKHDECNDVSEQQSQMEVPTYYRVQVRNVPNPECSVIVSKLLTQIKADFHVESTSL